MAGLGHIAHSRLEVILPPQMPVTAMMVGKPVTEVVELMPRLFNLCRSAQGVAIKMALGVSISADDQAALATEIWSEHLLRLGITLPIKLGMAPVVVGGLGSADPAGQLFGAAAFPADMPAFEAFLTTDTGIAPVLRKVREIFGPGVACCEKLPFVSDLRIMRTLALENSLAARHADHPVMRQIEADFGRGPLWRLVARALDFDAARAGRLFQARMIDDHTALVPAARGVYAIRARHEGGRVTQLTRVTPTDNLLAEGGVLAQSIARLPADKAGYAGLLIDILDPCVPVELKERADA